MIIRGARLIDGLGGDPLEDSLVALSGSHIEWVGKASEFGSIPEDEEVVEAENSTLLPGLINCHVHLSMDGHSSREEMVNSSATEVGFQALRHAANTLRGGVTTVRDCGSRTGAVEDLSGTLESGQFLGPRIVTSGRGLTMTGGHASWMSREVDGEDEVRKAVRREIKEGADWVKVMATGGVLTPETDLGAPTFTVEEIRSAVETAKQANVPVSAHCIGNAGIKNALRAGVDSVEHASYLDREALELFQETEASHVPTLSSFHRLVNEGQNSGMDSSFLQRARGAKDSNRESFIKSFEAGVNVGAGTDAGVPFNYHGGIGLELKLMVEAGVTPMEAIVITTGNAARTLGLEDRIGTVEEDKVADLLLVDGDPLQDIQRLGNPSLVIKDGTVASQGESDDEWRTLLMDPGRHL